MWCAHAFAALALVSLPSAIRSHDAVTIVSWINQTFLQLVLLSIIIVGQNVQSAAADARAEATYEDADAVLHTALEIQGHLVAQDREINETWRRCEPFDCESEEFMSHFGRVLTALHSCVVREPSTFSVRELIEGR
jgi:hypothetical protein